MVKEGCFSPKKTRKALDLQGLLCQGAKLLPHYGSPERACAFLDIEPSEKLRYGIAFARNELCGKQNCLAKLAL